jgi:hypothetical protein
MGSADAGFVPVLQTAQAVLCPSSAGADSQQVLQYADASRISPARIAGSPGIGLGDL